MGNIDNRKDEKTKLTGFESKVKNPEVMNKFYQTAQDIFHNMGYGETISIQIPLKPITKIVLLNKKPVDIGHLIISKPSTVTQITVRQK